MQKIPTWRSYNDVTVLYRLAFPNGKEYFGISNSPEKRWANHRASATNGSLTLVAKAIRKYGLDRAAMKLLVVGTRKYIKELEASIIALTKTNDVRFGYNIAAGGDASPMSVLEVAERVAAAKLGRPLSPAHRAALSRGQKRRFQDPAERLRQGERQTRRFESESEREKIRQAIVSIPIEIRRENARHGRVGKPWSEVRRASAQTGAAKIVATRRANGTYGGAAASDRQRKLWADPDWRAATIDAMRSKKAQRAARAGATELRVQVMRG